jgi:hypothetical protein
MNCTRPHLALDSTRNLFQSTVEKRSLLNDSSIKYSICTENEGNDL